MSKDSNITVASLFGTDTDLEKDGIKLDYTAFHVYIARAGGANTKFAKRLQSLMKPYRRQLENNTLSDEKAEEVTLIAFVETVLLGWGSEKHGEGKIEIKEGKISEYSRGEAIKIFEKYPEFYKDVKSQSNDISNFRKMELEEDTKN